MARAIGEWEGEHVGGAETSTKANDYGKVQIKGGRSASSGIKF